MTSGGEGARGSGGQGARGLGVRGAVRRLGVGAVVVAALTAHAQTPVDPSRGVTDRILALEREAAQLAGQAKTLLGELRALEVDRDLRVEQARRADAAAAAARRDLQATTERIATLDRQRLEQLPYLKAQLVDVYKSGRGGYARMLLDARGLREFARATRTASAMIALRDRRVQEHRRTVDALKRERDALEVRSRELRATDEAAARARAAAERAVAVHAARIEEIDSRRDLTAQYVGELQVAYEQLQQQLAGGERAAVPLVPFRGALAWPAAGPIRARFGQGDGRLGGTAVANGIEIGAAEGAPVTAVHGGTVTFADVFAGFGTLVTLDHGGNNVSLYGYLGESTVQRGDVVESGTELGRVGLSPGGYPALYFEMRIDGRSVDPVQWLLPAGSR
jgi:septal ring factor EnvC (AmiA/AmiB activator)